MKPTTRFKYEGAAATELAMLLPLTIFLCLAAVDFGRYAHSAIALENAARVGAEYGAGRRVTEFTYDTWEEEVETRVRDEFGESELETLEVTVEVSWLEDELPRVEVTGEFNFKTVIPWWSLPESIVIRRRSSLQRYR